MLLLGFCLTPSLAQQRKKTAKKPTTTAVKKKPATTQKKKPAATQKKPAQKKPAQSLDRKSVV